MIFAPFYIDLLEDFSTHHNSRGRDTSSRIRPSCRSPFFVLHIYSDTNFLRRTKHDRCFFWPVDLARDVPQAQPQPPPGADQSARAVPSDIQEVFLRVQSCPVGAVVLKPCIDAARSHPSNIL